VAKQISVPRTPASAYNPKRRVSDLLKAHITNLEAITGYGTAGSRRKPKTEAQASAYISEMTRQLHPALYASAAPPAPAPTGTSSPAVLSLPAPAARRRRTARKTKTPARAKSARASRRRTGKKTGKARKTRKTRKARKKVRRSSRY
jgi:hypothetical protein